jgi:hypothetical protein
MSANKNEIEGSFCRRRKAASSGFQRVIGQYARSEWKTFRLSLFSGSVIVTSHIDRFNPNNGLGPMIGHAVVDVFIGSVFFRHSAGLD